MKKIASILTLVLSAGCALGQCNIAKYGIPDFDQRRAGLDQDGSYHCVPTSCINLMGYIANRGRPAALGHSSPNWANSSEYAFVTGRIADMGDYMGTNSIFSTGTDLDGAVDGLIDYLDDHNVGPFIIVGHYGDEDWQVRPFMMYDDLKVGALVAFCFGRYKLDGDQWERDGGHCMTLCSMQDACNSTQCTIGFKDPAGDEDPNDLYHQSTFKTGHWDISKQTRNYDGDVYAMWGPAGQSAGMNDTIRLIDRFITVGPLFALTSDFNGNLLQHTAHLLNNDEQPPMHLASIPNHAPLLHAFIDPRSLNSIVVSGAIGGTHAKLWDYSVAENRFTEILDLPTAPSAFTIDRRGELLLVISGDLHKYKYLGDGSVRLLETAKVGTAMQSIAVDDKTDDIYALMAGQRRLLKFAGGSLVAPPYSGPLPENLPLGTQPCVAVNPADGKPWVTSEGSNSLYQLTPGGSAPGWTITGSLNVGSKPTCLQFGDKGQMKFVSAGKIHEFDRDPDGRYVPTADPVFDGQPASGFLALARSRTNFDPRIHTGPKWADVLAEDNIPETDDCPADFNVDGFVDGIDYDLFNNLFEQGDMNADFNFDGFVDGIDYDEFNNQFEKGC